MLKDDYETLLRRGMLPHHELRYSGGAWCLIQGHIEESDARDLITMHALRWMESMGDSYGVPFRCADIIDAILAATAHMEPR